MMRNWVYTTLFSAGLVAALVACQPDSATTPTPAPQFPAPKDTTIAMPAGLPRVDWPSDNKPTVEGIALGKALFFDPILSLDSSISCNSCHHQEYAFSDKPNARFSQGVGGTRGKRNSMPLFNMLWVKEGFFWDGRATMLRHQVTMPIRDPLEMKESMDNVMNKLSRHPQYPQMFGKAFGNTTINENRVALALEQFLFTMISATTKFDSVRMGATVFTPEEQRGFGLFMGEFRSIAQGGKSGADCFHCHQGALLTTGDFRNNGLDSLPQDIGHKFMTNDPNDHGKFRVPSLRNIALTAPYMHDGRFQTLEQVIDFYDHGVKRSATIDPNMKQMDDGLRLTPQDKADLIAFLKTMTDYRFVNQPAFKK